MRATDRTDADRGSSVADFVMVGALLTALFVLLLQLVLAVHVRNTLVDAASEGARYAALADRGPADGAARTRELIATALSPGYARDVTGSSTPRAQGEQARIEVRAPLPLLALWGPAVLVVEGHALEETW